MEELCALLEAKLARIARSGDEGALAFITTLLTCGGGVIKEFGYPGGFSDYQTLWGELCFREVKERLIAEGVIREDEKHLFLNYPGWQSLTSDQQEQVCRELSTFLLQEGWDFFSKAFQRVVSTPEGRYIVSELMKVGPCVSEGTVDHLMRAVGSKYFQDAKDQLARAGLFVYAWSSKRHDYYRFFTPLSLMTRLQTLDEALAFIYIAQYARPDGPTLAGVLTLDCTKYRKEILYLILQGAVREKRWYSLKGYATTAEGSVQASAIIEERLKQAQGILRGNLDTLPSKFLQFLWREVVKAGWNDARVVQPSSPLGFRDVPLDQESHLCLLNDAKVKELRDKVMEALVQQGLAVKVHTYVSTRGGEVRELTYVLAPEALAFFDDYMCSKGIPSDKPLFDESLELQHKLYHALEGPVRNACIAWDKRYWYEYGASQGVHEQQLAEAFNRALERGLLREDGQLYSIRDIHAYRKAIREEHLQPLVKALLKPEGVIEPVPNGPKPPKPLEYKITFPPYDDGSSLVLGHGPLKDRIALGFEAGKDLTLNTLVTWEIHNMDNPFICTFQQIGMGKSTLAHCIVLQAAFQGIPVVLFDPKPDYIASLIPIEKTIQRFPDYRQPVLERFRALFQDFRGFNLQKPINFEFEGKQLRLVYQIYSFSPELHDLGCRPLKMPLVTLPPRSDRRFREMCDSAATSLATAIHSQAQRRGYNAVLSEIFQRFREENPDKDYLLPSDLSQKLQEKIAGAQTKRMKARLEDLSEALQGFITANAWIYARNEQEVARPEELVQNPYYPDGDQTTVSVTVLDVSSLPQDKRNPARMTYISSVCGYLYNLPLRRKSPRGAQFLVIMDEAANYLPDPTDQFNNTLMLIRQGRSLGIRVWLIAQAPGQIEIQARNQAHQFVLSRIPEHTIRPELTRWQPDESWTRKLGQTEKGQALVIDGRVAKDGGVLCQLFTTPQTINLLNTRQIVELLQQGSSEPLG